jgi:hypothetical protein
MVAPWTSFNCHFAAQSIFNCQEQVMSGRPQSIQLWCKVSGVANRLQTPNVNAENALET